MFINLKYKIHALAREKIDDITICWDCFNQPATLFIYYDKYKDFAVYCGKCYNLSAQHFKANNIDNMNILSKEEFLYRVNNVLLLL